MQKLLRFKCKLEYLDVDVRKRPCGAEALGVNAAFRGVPLCVVKVRVFFCFLRPLSVSNCTIVVVYVK